MKDVNNLLKELGVSKVKLAKYLGVSRQMVYNYLEMNSLNDWPTDKKTKLLLLFGVDTINDIANIKPTNEFIMRVEGLLAESNSDISGYKYNNVNFKDLNKKNQKIINDIICIIHEKFKEDENSTITYDLFRYLLHFLQMIDDVEELKYVLAYFAKADGYEKATNYAFGEENQIIFEGIMYQAITLFNTNNISKPKVIEAHRKFELEIEQRQEEKLSRTQELNTVKVQALKELGYTEINEKNVTEVFEKIAEIQARKI